MKTRINLYLHRLRPVKELLPLKESLTYMLVSLSLMVIAYLSLVYIKSSTLTGNAQLKEQLLTVEILLATEQGKLKKLTTDTPLLREIERVKFKINEKKKVLSVLNKEFTDNTGFYALFDSLSTVKMNNVWLTHIAAQDGQLNFGGSALKSRDIPKWVNALQTTKVLNGEKFSNLSIKREENIVNFTLHNTPSFVTQEQE